MSEQDLHFDAVFIAYEWAIDVMIASPLLPGPVALWLIGVGEGKGNTNSSLRSIEFCCAFCGAQFGLEACARGCPIPAYMNDVSRETFRVSGDIPTPKGYSNPFRSSNEAFEALTSHLDPLTQSLFASSVTDFLISAVNVFETVWDPEAPAPRDAREEREEQSLLLPLVASLNEALRDKNCSAVRLDRLDLSLR